MMNYRQATTLFFQLVTICVMAIRFQCIFMDGRNLFKISMIYNSVCGCWHIDSGIACDLLDWLSFVIDLLLAICLSTAPATTTRSFCFRAICSNIFFAMASWQHSSEHGQRCTFLMYLYDACAYACVHHQFTKKNCAKIYGTTVILRCIWWCDSIIWTQRGCYMKYDDAVIWTWLKMLRCYRLSVMVLLCYKSHRLPATSTELLFGINSIQSMCFHYPCLVI